MTFRNVTRDTFVYLNIDCKRLRQPGDRGRGKWASVPYADATHIFITDDTPFGAGDNRVATYNKARGEWHYFRGNGDAHGYTARIVAATIDRGKVGGWIGAPKALQVLIQRRCSRCSIELKRAESIVIGLGPECSGKGASQYTASRAA